jgi:hypothetical protein
VATDTNQLRIISNAGELKSRLTRREAIGRFLGVVGAALAGAHVAGAHPVHRHLLHSETVLDSSARVAGDNWSPQALNAHQNETLVMLSERILPGAGEAQVNRLIDLLLTVETPENRQAFVTAMAVLDAESKNRFGGAVKAVNADQCNELLTLCSRAKSAKPAVERNSSSDDEEDNRAPIPGATLRDHFDNLKGWVVGAYYSTEQGMRELGWTEENYFDALPECEHPEGHA